MFCHKRIIISFVVLDHIWKFLSLTTGSLTFSIIASTVEHNHRTADTKWNFPFYSIFSCEECFSQPKNFKSFKLDLNHISWMTIQQFSWSMKLLWNLQLSHFHNESKKLFLISRKCSYLWHILKFVQSIFMEKLWILAKDFIVKLKVTSKAFSLFLDLRLLNENVIQALSER